MILIEKHGDIEIWHDAMTDEYYVYGVMRDPRVCPSLGMAREVAAQ